MGVVAQPQNGSSTISPALEATLMMRRKSFNGFCVLYSVFSVLDRTAIEMSVHHVSSTLPRFLIASMLSGSKAPPVSKAFRGLCLGPYRAHVQHHD